MKLSWRRDPSRCVSTLELEVTDRDMAEMERPQLDTLEAVGVLLEGAVAGRALLPAPRSAWQREEVVPGVSRCPADPDNDSMRTGNAR